MWNQNEDNKIGDINKEDYISMTLFDIGSSYLILAAVILYQSRNDGGWIDNRSKLWSHYFYKYQDLGIQSINIKTNSLVIIRSVE